MSKNLIIIGVSTRAAAMSAVAAGYEPWCADRFADVDQQSICTVERCDPWPAALIELMSNAPSGPFMYTGAMENRPLMLDLFTTKRRPLLGNSPDVLRAIRHPPHWTRALRRAGIVVPRCMNRRAKVPTTGDWLLKPMDSGGGIGIQRWTTELAASWSGDELGHFWQEQIPGTSLGSVFVAAQGNAVLLGTSRQLAQPLWCSGGIPQFNLFNEQPFLYCGSIGPLHLPDHLTAELQEIGQILAGKFQLQGLFGVDSILTADQKIVPVEINPRYTASVELLERASMLGTRTTRGQRLLSIALHVAACQEGKLPTQVLPATPVISGKAILFAPRSGRQLRFTAAAAQWAAVHNLGQYLPVVADLPPADLLIEPGHPIVTILTDGTSEEQVEQQLIDLASEFYELCEEA